MICKTILVFINLIICKLCNITKNLKTNIGAEIISPAWQRGERRENEGRRKKCSSRTF